MLGSLFTCHNESVNVWSHLLGSVFFLFILLVVCLYVVPEQFKDGKMLKNNFLEQKEIGFETYLDLNLQKLQSLIQNSNSTEDLPTIAL